MMSDPATWIWVLIPLAGISIAPVRMWFKLKEKQIDAQTKLAAEKSAQYAQHMGRFEGRLRVLEQIVTDSGTQTAAQIEALREPPPMPISAKTEKTGDAG
jgi:chemotaxis signal transduction protein